MNTCETCKYWEQRGWDRKIGNCDYVVMLQYDVNDANQKAFVVDREGEGAGLLTHVEFGCNQWSARKDTIDLSIQGES